MKDQWKPTAFVSEEITVTFDSPPVLRKRPPPPTGFTWREQTFAVEEVLSRWFDYGRRGDMAKNMQPAHLRVAAKRGSWGVGRFYFRVRTGEGRVFDLYYDRAPGEAGDRQGHWFLWRELEAKRQPEM